MLFAIIGVIVVGAVLWGPIVSNVEQAKYTVAEAYGEIEIREYAPMIVAEVEVSGERRSSLQQGFRMIADYIFGNNISAQKVAMTAPVIQQSSEKIAMTAPVIQQSSEKIAMTAPVIQQGENNDLWNVRFVMPENYTLATLPTPKNKAVKIKKIESKRFAVIRFSGIGSEKNLKKHTEELERFLKIRQLKAISAVTFAFFNPPWTLPFLRRNEIMIELVAK